MHGQEHGPDTLTPPVNSPGRTRALATPTPAVASARSISLPGHSRSPVMILIVMGSTISLDKGGEEVLTLQVRQTGGIEC